eukprot:m.175770 g.175770  ORF g.175770 m.175770 type:complete len:208 (-) comp14622_c2_seq1:420-1043(-)
MAGVGLAGFARVVRAARVAMHSSSKLAVPTSVQTRVAQQQIRFLSHQKHLVANMSTGLGAGLPQALQYEFKFLASRSLCTSRSFTMLSAFPTHANAGLGSWAAPVARSTCTSKSASPLAIVVPTRGIKTAKRQTKRRYRTPTAYKMKTKKAVASRFKLTKSGSIKFWRRGRVHNSSAKPKKKHRELRKGKFLSTGAVYKKLRRALQY